MEQNTRIGNPLRRFVFPSRRVFSCGAATASDQGFTLVELMVVMLIIAILASVAIPAYISSIRSAREAVLREDLHVLRNAIDSYTNDKDKEPQSLDDLVSAGYLKAIPKDPITQSSDSWVPVMDDNSNPSSDQDEPGITDIHSGSDQAAGDGTKYSDW
jgi:general secretion pathway protein G